MVSKVNNKTLVIFNYKNEFSILYLKINKKIHDKDSSLICRG